MNNKKILGSSQGVKGGYKLERSLEDITYLELLEIIEQKCFDKNCSEINCSLIESCNITGPIQKLNQQLISFFKSITLNSLLTSEDENIQIQNLDQDKNNEYRIR